jgi:Tfp pilus assembly protein PilO
MLEKMSQSKRIGFFAAFIVIVSIGIYNWMVWQHINYLMAAQQYQSVSTELVSKNKNLVNNITSLKQKLQNLQSDFNGLNSRLLSDSDAKNFFDNIQNVAEQYNCTVLSLNFLTTDTLQDQTVNIKRAKLKVAGNYKDIVSLMNKLQGDKNQILLDSVSINSDIDSGKLQCDMNITLYVSDKGAIQ